MTLFTNGCTITINFGHFQTLECWKWQGVGDSEVLQTPKVGEPLAWSIGTCIVHLFAVSCGGFVSAFLGNGCVEPGRNFLNRKSRTGCTYTYICPHFHPRLEVMESKICWKPWMRFVMILKCSHKPFDCVSHRIGISWLLMLGEQKGPWTLWVKSRSHISKSG